MIVKAPPLDIPQEDPFRNDALDRFESVEILTHLLSTFEEPFVLAIDSPFGMGKTTFLTMWKQYLRQKGFPVLSFNAWETDFTGDPLVSFVGEMAIQMESIGGSEDKAKEYLSKAKELAGALAKRSLPVAIKIATAGLLDRDQLTEDTLGNLAEKIAQERIESYEADKKTIKGFKERLEAFIRDLPRHGQLKSLIVLVDELDRCRPSYAVDLLERIKHFFDVRGLIFVLAVDRAQMIHSIRSLYGSGMDADGYLRRFIDLEYRLPKPSGERYCRSLYQRFGFEKFFKTRTGDSQHDERNFIEIFPKLAAVFDLSLRAQKQIFSLLSVVFRTVEQNVYIFPHLLATVVVLKACNPDLYRKFIEGHASAKDIIDYIGAQPRGKAFLLEDRSGMLVEAYLHAAMDNGGGMEKIITQYQKKSENGMIGEPERNAAKEVARFLTHLATKEWFGMLPYLVKKIEIAERFV